jgi:acyl-CoA thioesterase I
MLMCAGIAANAAPVRIVAIGASNTHGWYVGNQGAYPAQLQDLLRARGTDARITNAGVPWARSIKVIVYDEKLPLRYYTLDFIHWTREGHAVIAAALLPRVLAVLDGQRSDELPNRDTDRH